MHPSTLVSRRSVLAGVSAVAAAAMMPECLQAAATAGLNDWRVAFADLEGDVSPLPLALVHGQPPRELCGTLYRNGPARFHRPGGSATHWFDGDGLVRALSISEEGVTLRARFVDTPKRRTDSAANAVITGGFGTRGHPRGWASANNDVNPANTSVIAHGGRLWALSEAGSPMDIDPATLHTEGVRIFRQDLAHVPFLAHPRVDSTGHLWSLGQRGKRALIWRLGPDGSLEAATPLMLPRASYIHDFALTPTHIVIVLQPWMYHGHGTPLTDVLEWREQLGTQVLVIDRQDLSRQRVFELPPFFFFHIGSAWNSPDGAIFLDVCQYPDPSFAIQGGRDVINGVYRPAPPSTLALIVLSPDGSASLRDTGLVAELPQAYPQAFGQSPATTLYATLRSSERPVFQGVGTYDWQTERSQQFDFGDSHVVEEMLFVPRSTNASFPDGWIVGCSINLRESATELHVFEPDHLADGPLCTWRAPIALPMGLHGTFVSA